MAGFAYSKYDKLQKNSRGNNINRLPRVDNLLDSASYILPQCMAIVN